MRLSIREEMDINNLRVHLPEQELVSQATIGWT